MQYRRAVEVIGYNKLKIKVLGKKVWIITIGLGILGWIEWKWFALPIATIAAWAMGNIYALYITKRLEKLTGLNIHEQIVAYNESLAAERHPITRDPHKYLEYIRSIPDEEP